MRAVYWNFWNLSAFGLPVFPPALQPALAVAAISPMMPPDTGYSRVPALVSSANVSLR